MKSTGRSRGLLEGLGGSWHSFAARTRSQKLPPAAPLGFARCPRPLSSVSTRFIPVINGACAACQIASHLHVHASRQPRTRMATNMLHVESS